MNPNGRPEFRARYWVESFEPLEKVAEIIAGEQSSGTFLRLAGETDELRERSRGAGGFDITSRSGADSEFAQRAPGSKRPSWRVRTR